MSTVLINLSQSIYISVKMEGEKSAIRLYHLKKYPLLTQKDKTSNNGSLSRGERKIPKNIFIKNVKDKTTTKEEMADY